MRIDQGHQRQKAIVGNTEDADFAVALGNVFDQPVDRVVGVGRVIDRRRVQRPTQRPVHDIVAFRAVLAADVRDNPNVAAFDNHFGGVVIAVEDWTKVRAGRVTRQLSRVVRRTR